MVKKLPILLSTLTVLANAFTVVNVSASGDQGPWSFDELVSANSEIEAEASIQCTESFTRPACINSLMENRGGIYYTGLWKFRYNQLTPLSLNFATGEMGYYYNSTNEYRKINNKRPYLKDYLTKLFIVQVEQGYDNWSADLRAGIKDNEHWQVLYDGTITEEGTSLLPYDQKASLTINKPSFDPKYEKYLRVLYMNTFSDSAEINTYDFRECAEDRTCEAWYDASNPFLYFKDFSYTDGYNDGYEAGRHDGEIDGYEAGYEAGHHDGQIDGYRAGYEAGYNEGQSEGLTTGYDSGLVDGQTTGYQSGYADGYANGQVEGQATGYQSGYTDGHENGLDEGRENGLAEGYNEGYAEGHTDGQAEGYNNGYTDGHENGFNEGYQAGQNAGYQSGQSDGYQDGYLAGYQAGQDANNTPDQNDELNTQDTTTNNGVDTNNQGDNITNNGDDMDNHGDIMSVNNSETDSASGSLDTDTNALSVHNPTSTSGITLSLDQGGIASQTTPDKASISSPDTGAPTGEKGITEFPWWIGAISLLTLSIFAWFFGPKSRNHKKSPKNPKKVEKAP